MACPQLGVILAYWKQTGVSSSKNPIALAVGVSNDVKNFKMKEKDMNLVFRVDQKEDQMYLNNVRSIRIHYSVFGIRRSRIIDFMEEV